MTTKAMRSWMFVPGNSERFLRKAATVEADVVILDLEDGVPVAEKFLARERVRAALQSSDFVPQCYVRLNAVDTPWFEDDALALAGLRLSGVCVPKVSSPETITTVAERLSELERTGALRRELRILAAIESASGLLAAAAIAAASPRVSGLIFGAEDFALDIGLSTSRVAEARELVYARSAVVVAAASAHVMSIDGVYPHLGDPEGMRIDCQRARQLGFSGKSTFNPRQVGEINGIFSPRSEEVEYARRVVVAFEDAQRRGDGSVAVGGQLVDLPIVLRAQRVLAMAEALGDDGGAA